jgi:NAD-reducing hydrogenase small subunit
MSEVKTLATVWLDGCSGCHMSLLDLDERLIELSSQFQLVYSPLVDRKTFPDRVDVTLVEGAVASVDDLKKIRKIREHTRVLVSLGDCALTGNVSAMRNTVGVQPVLFRVYEENVLQKQIPTIGVPALLDRVCPVHEVVPVDVFVPGCPPSADTIYQVLSELLAGRVPSLGGVAHFG